MSLTRTFSCPRRFSTFVHLRFARTTRVTTFLVWIVRFTARTCLPRNRSAPGPGTQTLSFATPRRLTRCSLRRRKRFEGGRSDSPRGGTGGATTWTVVDATATREPLQEAVRPVKMSLMEQPSASVRVTVAR